MHDGTLCWPELDMAGDIVVHMVMLMIHLRNLDAKEMIAVCGSAHGTACITVHAAAMYNRARVKQTWQHLLIILLDCRDDLSYTHVALLPKCELSIERCASR